MSSKPPVWFREFNADHWPKCPVCRQDSLVSLAMIDYKDHGLAPDLAQALRGPMKCTNCGWEKSETRT